MLRGLVSRMLVAVLLIAVVAKPCLGLLVEPAHAAEISVVMSDEATLSDDGDSTCDGLCLSARVEEDDTAALRPSTNWTPAVDRIELKILGAVPAPYVQFGMVADWSPQPLAPRVLRRLAVLSRFLL